VTAPGTVKPAASPAHQFKRCAMKKIMTVAWLEKLARHLALLTCLAILFKASGRADPAPLAILALAIFASAAHLCGKLAGRDRRPKRAL
jgi:hypothetical protein